MAEQYESAVSTVESVMEKIGEKIHGSDSSSSDSEDEKPVSSSSSVKDKIYRLFGREKPIHKVLGGGKRTAISSLSLRSEICHRIDYALLCHVLKPPFLFYLCILRTLAIWFWEAMRVFRNVCQTNA